MHQHFDRFLLLFLQSRYWINLIGFYDGGVIEKEITIFFKEAATGGVL